MPQQHDTPSPFCSYTALTVSSNLGMGTTITLTDSPTILAIANALRNGTAYTSRFSDS
jgi:hypothetical protein